MYVSITVSLSTISAIGYTKNSSPSGITMQSRSTSWPLSFLVERTIANVSVSAALMMLFSCVWGSVFMVVRKWRLGC